MIDRITKDKALLKALRRRVNKARDFPTHTCPASRHLHIMADNLTKKGGYPMLTEEPEHCAITLYSVLASLWEARKELHEVGQLSHQYRNEAERLKRSQRTYGS